MSAMNVRIYHNPRCSKSRQTLQLLTDRGIELEIIEYLDSPPDAATLLELAGSPGIPVRELVRTGEDDYKANRDEVDALDAAALADWMAAHPRVIQRPIVVSAKGARVGRPPDTVLEILD